MKRVGAVSVRPGRPRFRVERTRAGGWRWVTDCERCGVEVRVANSGRVSGVRFCRDCRLVDPSLVRKWEGGA